MKRAALVALLLAGCGDLPAAPPPAPPPDAGLQDFIPHMRTLDRQFENLQADLADRKPEDGIRERLGKMRSAAVSASRISIRPSAAENRDLRLQFDIFLESLGRLEKGAWTGEDGVRNWRSLNAACTVCHALYKAE